MNHLPLICCLFTLLASSEGLGKPDRPDSAETPRDTLLFVVHYSVGPRWDQSKSPGEQTYFKEHSAMMQKLRKEGTTVLGGRYADRGLLVMRAASEKELRALLETDLSVLQGTMQFEIHLFSVFYGGCIQSR